MSVAVDAARLAALPSPPFVSLEGVLNARSLDTYISGPMRIVRSGEFTHITTRGQESLRALGVKRVFDLRSDTEKERQPNPSIDGIENYNAMIFDHYTPEQMKAIFLTLERDRTEGFMERYTEMLNHGGSGYGAILRHICDRPDEGILIHCSAGKDRTGVIIAVILSLAGTSDDIIVADYALSKDGLAPYEAIIAQRFTLRDDWKAHPEGGRRLLSSEPETMKAFLKILREQYGGAEGYCAKIGFTVEEIARIKANLRASIG